MKVAEESICKTCKRIFCCAKCRVKHEVKNHAIIVKSRRTLRDGPMDLPDTICMMCPICEEKPLLLKTEIYEELLKHVQEAHLPLKCQKCDKVYNEIGDLRDFTRCIRPTPKMCVHTTDQTCDTEISKATMIKGAEQMTISTQTSPMRDFNDSHITPISMLQVRWKANKMQIHEGFNSDSASSIRNLSSINNSSHRRSIGNVAAPPKGKLVRSTSTPVQSDLFSKPKDREFNASGGAQVSSIHTSTCDSDVSAHGVQAPNGSPAKLLTDNINRLRKVGARPKITAVTPLRHVMSKSIQKALATHGAPTNLGGSQFSSPLDLRLSPVIRRTQSESSHSSDLGSRPLSKTPTRTRTRTEILVSSKKLTTESIVITRRTQDLASLAASSNNQSSMLNSIEGFSKSLTSGSSVTNSVYQSCRSVEIITSSSTSTEISEVNIQHAAQELMDGLRTLAPLTPITSIQGAFINKKIIKFETPQVSLAENGTSQINETTDDEAFFTPQATPMSKPTRMKSFTLESLDEGGQKCVSRNVKGHTYELRRPPTLSECTRHPGFSRIETVEEDYDDDVFLTEEEMQKPAKPLERKWSLTSLVNSMIRLPSLTSDKSENNQEEQSKIKAGANSLIKRCASIAGSLIRSNPFMDPVQLKTLKRKRAYTADSKNQSERNVSDSTSPNTDTEMSTVTRKRFRIHGRKPIDRYRQNY